MSEEDNNSYEDSQLLIENTRLKSKLDTERMKTVRLKGHLALAGAEIDSIKEKYLELCEKYEEACEKLIDLKHPPKEEK